MLSVVLLLCSAFLCSRAPHPPSPPPATPGGPCEGLCSCEQRDGVLHVDCESRGIVSLAQVRAPPRSPFHLNLYRNELVELRAGDVAALGGAVALHLGGNSIQELEPGVFSALRSLRKLHVNGNFLVALRGGAFDGLGNLEYLQADSNFIRVVERGALGGLGRLRVLILNDNAIEALPGDVFRFVPLTHLDLRGNRLRALPYVGLLEHLGRIVELRLEDNEWACDCGGLPLKAWVESVRARASVGRVVCGGPPELRGAPLASLGRDALCPARPAADPRDVTPTPEVRRGPVAPETPCVLRCSCHMRPDAGLLVHCEDRGVQRVSELGVPDSGPSALVLSGNRIRALLRSDFVAFHGLELLDLAENRLESMEDGTFLGLSRLRRLYLNENRITRIAAATFTGLHHLERLYLEFNAIEEIEAGAFDTLTSLRLLFLNNNLLTTLPAQVFRNVPLSRLDLGRNLFAHLSVDTLEQLGSVEQLHLQENPWDCTCDLLGLKGFVERLGREVGALLCRSPRKLAGVDVRTLPREALCPGPLGGSAQNPPQDSAHDPLGGSAPDSLGDSTHDPLGGSALDPLVDSAYDPLGDSALRTTPAPVGEGGMGVFFRGLSDAVPLSVLVLCLLLLFLTAVFCAAGAVAVALRRRSRDPEVKRTEERAPAPVHLRYSVYGHKTTRHVSEGPDPDTDPYGEARRSPVVRICRNPGYCARHPETEHAKKHGRVLLSIADTKDPGPLSGPLGDAGSPCTDTLERERELRQLCVAEYLREKVPGRGGFQELVYTGPKRLVLERSSSEYFQLQASLRAEPDYLQVLERRAVED